HHAAAAMTYLLAGYFEYTVGVDEGLAVSHWGLTAARRLGDPSGEVVLRFIRAGACNLAHRPQEALEVLDGVPEMARRLGNPRAATAGLLPGVELARDVEAREQEEDGLHLLGEADLQRADPAAAIGWLDRALSLAHASGNRYQAAAVQATLGVAHLRAGHL